MRAMVWWYALFVERNAMSDLCTPANPSPHASVSTHDASSLGARVASIASIVPSASTPRGLTCTTANGPSSGTGSRSY
jgi:hypothetical protein